MTQGPWTLTGPQALDPALARRLAAMLPGGPLVVVAHEDRSGVRPLGDVRTLRWAP